MNALQQINKKAADSKKAAATRTAGRWAGALAFGVLALAAYQITHGQVVDWGALGVFAALLIGTVIAPFGVQVHAQARVDREVLTESVRAEKKAAP